MDELEECLAKFRTLLAPEAVVPEFEISDRYDIKSDWQKSLPHAAEAGVYLIYSADETLLYIGKASAGSTIGRRLDKYFKGADGQGVSRKNMKWTKEPRYIRAVKVASDFKFFAPALEEFLIDRMQPPDNRQGG